MGSTAAKRRKARRLVDLWLHILGAQHFSFVGEAGRKNEGILVREVLRPEIEDGFDGVEDAPSVNVGDNVLDCLAIEMRAEGPASLTLRGLQEMPSKLGTALLEPFDPGCRKDRFVGIFHAASRVPL